MERDYTNVLGHSHEISFCNVALLVGLPGKCVGTLGARMAETGEYSLRQRWAQMEEPLSMAELVYVKEFLVVHSRLLR